MNNSVYVYIASMWSERWVRSNGGMILTGKSGSDKKACPSATQITRILRHKIQRRGPGGAIGMATAYGLDGPGIESR